MLSRGNIFILLALILFIGCQKEPNIENPDLGEMSEWLGRMDPSERRTWLEEKYADTRNRRALLALFSDIDARTFSEENQLLLLEVIRDIGLQYDVELIGVASIASGHLVPSVRLNATSMIEELSFDRFSIDARVKASRMIDNLLFRAEELDQTGEAVQRREQIVARLRDYADQP